MHADRAEGIAEALKRRRAGSDGGGDLVGGQLRNRRELHEHRICPGWQGGKLERDIAGHCPPMPRCTENFLVITGTDEVSMVPLVER